MFVKDYSQLMRRDLGPYRDQQHPKTDVAVLLTAKLCYYVYAIVVPLLVLHIPWWQTLIGFAVVHFTAGTILGVVFQLAHVVEPTSHPLPDSDGDMEADWWLHELRTTADFGRNSRLLSWYVGGLNHQVEHHLFPRVCSVHYTRISGIVQEVARTHGLPYHDQPTLASAIASHYRTLRRLGRADSVEPALTAAVA